MNAINSYYPGTRSTAKIGEIVILVSRERIKSFVVTVKFIVSPIMMSAHLVSAHPIFWEGVRAGAVFH